MVSCDGTIVGLPAWVNECGLYSCVISGKFQFSVFDIRLQDCWESESINVYVLVGLDGEESIKKHTW